MACAGAGGGSIFVSRFGRVAFDHPDCYELCVRLSFEHGLKKLEGLRKLRELNVSRIDHKMRGRELK